MVGELAVSLAGHDKGTVYLVVREDENNVYLADGAAKKYAQPKKKNKKHVQRILKGLSEQELEALETNPTDADTKIRRHIKLYHERKA